MHKLIEKIKEWFKGYSNDGYTYADIFKIEQKLDEKYGDIAKFTVSVQGGNLLCIYGFVICELEECDKTTAIRTHSIDRVDQKVKENEICPLCIDVLKAYWENKNLKEEVEFEEYVESIKVANSLLK